MTGRDEILGAFVSPPEARDRQRTVAQGLLALYEA
jgi:hypothetical protein